MANRFWPFRRSQEITKQDDAAYTVSIGATTENVYASTTQDSNLAYYADQVYTNSLVYSCIRELATSVSDIDFVAVTPTREGDYEDFIGPLADLVRNPNPAMTQVDFIEKIVEQLSIYGNVYVYLQRAGRGGSTSARITELHLLRPDLVQIIPGDVPGGIKFYRYTANESGTDGVEIPPENIAHMKYPNNTTGIKTGGLYGLSPLAILKNDVQMDDLLSDLSMNFVKRGAVPSGLLKLQKRITSQEDADEVRKRWTSTFSGKKGQWNVAILDSDSEYEPLQALPKDLALEPTRDEVVARICAVLGVPPIIVGAHLGLKRSTYSNYRQARASYRDETVAPLANRIARFINLQIAPNFAGNAIIHVDFAQAAAWQENETERADRTRSLYESGILSLNEARQEIGLDPINSGDVRRTPAAVFEVDVDSTEPLAQLSAPDPASITTLYADPALDREKAYSETAFKKIYERVQARNEEALEEALRRLYFKPIKNRIDGVVGRRLSETIGAENQYSFTVDDLMPVEMRHDLSKILVTAAEGVIRDVYLELSESGLVPVETLGWKRVDLEFQKAPAHWSQPLKQIVEEMATLANSVHQTGRKIIANTVQTGINSALSVEALMAGGKVGGKSVKGLAEVVNDMTVNRSKVVARTQTTLVHSAAQLEYFRQAEIEWVTFHDGTQFDAKCSDRNDVKMTLDRARQESLAHPNCTMWFSPANPPPDSEAQLVLRSTPPKHVAKETPNDNNNN